MLCFLIAYFPVPSTKSCWLSQRLLNPISGICADFQHIRPRQPILSKQSFGGIFFLACAAKAHQKIPPPYG